QEDLLRRIVFQLLGVSDKTRHQFWVSASSGWMFYTDTQRVWRNDGTPSPVRTGSDAKKKAEEFIQRFKAALAERAAQPSSPLANLVIVPPMNPLDPVIVPRAGKTGWDHWLYRAQPQLARDFSVKLDVLGSCIEIRIGDAGAITSFAWRWRPLTGERTTATTTTLANAISKTADDKGNTFENRQVYVLDGDGIPQYYLSPYHIVSIENEYALAPASNFSLSVSYGVIARDDGSSDVTAVVSGGSGSYEFAWASYTYDDPWLERGIQILESSEDEIKDDLDTRITTSTTNVVGGAGVVMVHVRDRSTGAFKHHQQPLFGYPTILGDAPLSQPPAVA
ncbi:MAG: hypothetical protein ABI591_32430, partial [Kofleriaceae bacterium]